MYSFFQNLLLIIRCACLKSASDTSILSMRSCMTSCSGRGAGGGVVVVVVENWKESQATSSSSSLKVQLPRVCSPPPSSPL